VDQIELGQRVLRLWPDVGVALGLSRNSTYEAAARGEIPFLVRIGRRLMVKRGPFLEWLAGNSNTPAGMLKAKAEVR
jgi:predicted DNA-binding transcriptional regulator AlpA